MEGDRASAREEKEQRVREAKKAFFIDEQRKLYPVSLTRNGSLYTLLLVRAISSSSSPSFLLQFVTVHHQNKALEEGNRNGEKRGDSQRARERERGSAGEEEKEKKIENQVIDANRILVGFFSYYNHQWLCDSHSIQTRKTCVREDAYSGRRRI